jgi:thioredoxin 1
MQIPWISPVFSIALLATAVSTSSTSSCNPWRRNRFYGNKERWTQIKIPRGGNDPNYHNSGGVNATTIVEEVTSDKRKELTLDEKVNAAMKKLGLNPPSPMSLANGVNEESEASLNLNVQSDSKSVQSNGDNVSNCANGVCDISQGNDNVRKDENVPLVEEVPNDPSFLADRISQKLNVDLNMAWAALGATSISTENNKRIYNETTASDMIRMELDMISQIQEDSDDVKTLVAEGYDSFFVRRALAFAERNVNDARAILLADKLDEEEEVAAAAAQVEAANKLARIEEKQQLEASFTTLDVDASFDPTKIEKLQTEPPLPKATSRDSVIYDATAAQIQELVLESPVPVLLDIYADWCGPCKALSPILEEMAMKSGGSLRLVKVNSDNERAVSQALEVTALPTVFGVREGKILHMFEGMPKSEEIMRNFLMGLLIPGHAFNPLVSEAQALKYSDLSTKLVKVAATASFSFSARERLQDRIAALLDNLVQQSGNILDAEQAVVTIRSLLSNVIRDPYEPKFRTINLSNKVLASKIAKYPASVTILKSMGFVKDGLMMKIGKGKSFVNVAPLSTTRDAIDKWIDRTRYEVAREERKRRDEEDRVRIQAELAVTKESNMENNNSNDSVSKVIDPDACLLNLRIDGKKKVYNISLHADDPLSAILDRMTIENIVSPIIEAQKGDILITCVAKRLAIKSTDKNMMKKSLRDYGLLPTANIVIKLPSSHNLTSNYEGTAPLTKSSKLAYRSASKKKLKKGTHTMQSIGIYSTEDNAKGELIDGGGGTWYEHDVSDDEEATLKDLEHCDEKPNGGVEANAKAKKNEVDKGV